MQLPTASCSQANVYRPPPFRERHTKQPQQRGRQTEMTVTQPSTYRNSHVGYQREHLSRREMVVEMVEIATSTEFSTYTQIPPPLVHAVQQRRQSQGHRHIQIGTSDGVRTGHVHSQAYTDHPCTPRSSSQLQRRQSHIATVRSQTYAKAITESPTLSP